MKQAPVDQPISYASYRFPPEVISYAECGFTTDFR